MRYDDLPKPYQRLVLTHTDSERLNWLGDDFSDEWRESVAHYGSPQARETVKRLLGIDLPIEPTLISMSFTWKDTPEGRDFWEQVDEAESYKELPELKLRHLEQGDMFTVKHSHLEERTLLVRSDEDQDNVYGHANALLCTYLDDAYLGMIAFFSPDTAVRPIPNNSLLPITVTNV